MNTEEHQQILKNNLKKGRKKKKTFLGLKDETHH